MVRFYDNPIIDENPVTGPFSLKLITSPDEDWVYFWLRGVREREK